MKKNRICIVLLAAVLLVLALSSCDQPSVTSAEVNEKGELVLTYDNGTVEIVENYKGIVDVSLDENGHLILKYSDGSTEDKGIQTIPAVTVTFVDHDGTVLATEKTYRGLGVEAPASPEREDYVFAGWDKSFDAVTADMTVTATYTPLPTYTVTFKNGDTVLKTETVVSGKDATPPAETPKKDGFKFKGWSGDYTNVTQNLEITAIFEEKGTYTVTFVDYSGRYLGEQKTKEGGSVTAPVTPTRDGYTFRGWSSSLSNITQSKTVTAQYNLISAANVFDIAYKVSGDTVTVTLSLAGNVSLAGFEGTLSFEGMTATAVTGNSANVLANLKQDGTVSVAYTSATNVTRGETVLTVTLTKAQNASNGKATLTLKDCFDQNFDAVDYKIIGENMKLEGEAQ